MSDPDKAAQEAAWREIVENFGERVELADQPEIEDVIPFGDDIDETFVPDSDVYDDDDVDVYDHDRFVAPRPSLPRTTPERFVAWLGVLGAPVVAVLLFIARVSFDWWIPNWLVVLVALGFLLGFGYLVFSMPREPRDPWDDGARL